MNKTLALMLAVSVHVMADEDSFRERFADPETRAEALAELVPGTREAYFHTALHQQLTGRDADFRKTLAEWKAASQRKVNPLSTEGMSVLENRAILLEYGTNPQRSLTELIRGLDLKFEDTRPNAEAAAAQLPTRLDPALIREEAFEKAAAAIKPEEPYSQFRGSRLLRELEQVETFDDRKIRWFLANLDRSDLPGVVPLIVQSLAIKEPAVYDNLRFRKNLTHSQLVALLELRPELRSNLSFACDYLTRLKPGAETDFERDPAAHAEHLRRCRDFVLTLPPALNSLKAHVLFHHLRLQLEAGNFPKDDLLTYLALPRQSHGFLRNAERNERNTIQTNIDFKDATACPPVQDDTELLTAYLNHFLGQTDNTSEFAPFIQEKKLVVIHARARLLAGAEPSRWAAALDAAEFKALQEESSISFAPQSPRLLGADEKVSLPLDLKNTPDLLVRIYEIDQPAHLARHGSEPDVNLDLDGLVPHHERKLKFQQKALVRHRELIELPELDGPGVWLVDFVSGQVSARALVRKGNITPYLESTASSQIVRVFDENGKPVIGFHIDLGRETLAADANGRVTVPDSGNQAVTRGIVNTGKLAASINLGTREEEPKLEARFHLDREQLIADRQATLQVRLNLSNRGFELPLDRIKDPALVMKAELLGDITTERVITENLKLAPLMEIPFQVPADLLKLTLTLRGTVTPVTGGDPVKLSAVHEYELNGGLKTSGIATSFFTSTTEGHRLEIRGRNGEPLASREITLRCGREDYQTPIEIRVRSDANGRVDLGSLEGISSVSAGGSGDYRPAARRLRWPERMQVPKDSEIRLPLDTPANAPLRVRMSLLERLGDPSIRDHFDKLSIENGELVIRGLPPGDYQLKDQDESVNIMVSSAAGAGDLLVSKNRILPRHQPVTPSITSAAVDGDQILVKLRGQGPGTRVSAIGRRYQFPGWAAGSGLKPFAPPLPETFVPGFHGCDFLTDRRLSDEVRYIFDRRAAKTYPGSMLPRPGLLLNRWTEEDTEQQIVGGGSGARGSERGGPRGSGLGSGGGVSKRFGMIPADGTTCDFLNHPSIVRIDLTPDADGTVRLPLADFADSQFIEISAVDAFAEDMRILPLPAREVKSRDLRLSKALDPKIHYQATRSTAVLAKDATASIENVLDADWRAFHTLEDVHQFLFGVLPDDRLREFVFLTEWPELSEERKLELLSKHASHELHVFLFRKDRAFFDKHVKPLLAQKPEPTFIDDWLLQRDLSGYLRPYAWQRLNAAEKALLARALPDAAKRISRELFQRWELERPSPEQETRLFTQTLRGTDLATTDSLGLARNEEVPVVGSDESSGVSYLSEKLKRIIIPKIDFEDTTVEEAIDFLRMKSVEMDTLELDPSKRGISFVVRRPKSTLPPTAADGDVDAGGPELPSASVDPGSLRIPELRLRNVPLNVALKYICDGTKLRFKVDDYAVTLVPFTECGEDIYTRTFRVPPDFVEKLSSSGGGEDDPFAEPSGTGRGLSARKPVSELFREAGISFPDGSSASLTATGVLLITNTPTELAKVEQLVGDLKSNTIKPTRAEIISDEVEDDTLAEPASDSFALLPPLPSTLPRFPEHTKRWREADYYRNIQPTDERLIPLNRFWLDLAAWDGRGDFLSANFNACHTSCAEALMCLALLDLPFEADRPEVSTDGGRLNVKAKSPMLLFYKDTRKADEVAKESPLLVRQSFTPLAEKTRVVDGQEVENPVTGNFRPGLPYAMSLVVTNPTGVGRRLDVLAQIPAGSIPLEGNQPTLSATREIEPHGVLKLELAFYFPAAGDFAVYPLQVGENQVVLASTTARTLRVTNDAEAVDAASWLALAADGTGDAVLNRLRTENLKTIDLSAIRWRLKDRAFFGKVMEILRDRLHYDAGTAAYGLFHNDAAAVREYVENSPLAGNLGDWLDSPLIDIRPRVHHDWHTLEFDPLVNPRAHRFTAASRFTDEATRTHYRSFLDQLKWKPVLDDADQLTLTAFLFLQDRIGEALDRFAKIRPENLPGRVNYDYLKAVALFYQEKPEEAKAIAAAQLPTLPPGLWRDRFQTVVDQADEIAALSNPAAERAPDAAEEAPRLEIAAGDKGSVWLKHSGLERAKLRLFSVDLEMLFSKDPFLKGGESGEPSIRPNEVIDVTLAKDARETTVTLPEPLRQGNVLVSAESGETRLLKVLDSRAIELRQVPQDRVVQVMDAATGKPLPRTYIKVYAENRDGEIVFHKDGYTDLRGKFDYLSHTAVDSSAVKRVALLASHPEKGAKTVIYDR